MYSATSEIKLVSSVVGEDLGKPPPPPPPPPSILCEDNTGVIYMDKYIRWTENETC